MASEETVRPGDVPTRAYVRFMEDVLDYALFFLDPEGNVASWGAGAQRLTGYDAAEIVGRHLSILYPPTDVSSHRALYELRVATARGRFEEEGWRLRKDGSMLWANVVLTALRDGGGQLIGFATIMRDLTTRRHEEGSLRASEERFRILTESVRDYAIFMLDRGGHVASWNAGALKLKGYTQSEILGEHFSRFYTEEDKARDHPAHELDIALREGRYEEEGWRIRKDGTRFWASVTITALFDPSGDHIGFAKVTRDLSARKLMEEELRERAAIYARINRELDAFSHAVAHDLRSPIRAVEHLSSVLLEEEGEHLSESGRSSLQALHKTSLGMAKLVQGLLELSTASGRDPIRHRVDLSSLARDVVSETTRELGRAVDFRIEEGLEARADPNLLRIVLTNLLGNAVKFTRKSDLPLIEVGRAQTTEGPAFFVRDNGVGFDPALASDLFQPFSRLHAVTEFEGTGIGLATVHRIIHRHGGRAWAEGKPGHGATFYFTLPEAA